MVGRGFPRSRAGRLIAFGILVVAWGCGSDGASITPPDPEEEEEENPFPRNPDSPFECERDGYPCLWVDASPAVVATIEEVLDSLRSLGNRGLGLPEARAQLEARSDLVELIGDDDALRFRLEGAGPVWVVENGDPVLGGGEEVVTVTPLASPTPQAAPVGDDPYLKRALVLAPFLYEFAPYDESPDVAARLAKARGYSPARVTFVANGAFGAQNVTLDHFRNWGRYDVIHVSTHGKTECIDNHCRAYIWAAKDPRRVRFVMEDWKGIGVMPLVALRGQNRDSVGVHVTIDANFFKDEYGGGLHNAIVNFSACETVGPLGSDLADAIAGSSSAYLGWSAPVQAGHSRTASLTLYDLLIEQGTPLRSALEQLGTLKLNEYFDGDEFISAQLFRHGPFPPTDHRIRETVWIEHPENEIPLEPGDGLTPRGRLGDGQPDSLAYRIRVDGMEGSPLDYHLTIEIDGAGIDHPTLVEGTQVGDLEWVVAGVAPLTRDVSEGDRVSVKAYVELPDEGRTEQELLVEMIAPPPSEWIGSATHVVSSSLLGTATTVTTDARQLVFERVADPTYPPGAERYEVASGQILWSIEGQIGRSGRPDCTFAQGPFGFDVVPGSAYIEIDPNVPSGPPRYRLFANFEERTITIATSCADVDFTTRIQSAWMAVFSDEDRRLSADGSTIAGSKQTTRNQWTWDLTRYTPTDTPTDTPTPRPVR